MPFWIELRPGVFSDDSATYLHQVLTGRLENAKPYFFARFLQLTSLDGNLLQRLALVLALIGIALLARILAIGWRLGAPWWLLALAVLLLLNPYVQVMLQYIQNDVLFCIGIGSVLAETLWCVRRQRVGVGSMLLIAACAPMALLFRQNGLLFLPPWLLTLPLLAPVALWSRLALPALAACALALGTVAGVDTSTTVNSRFPAVIHVIAGLARPEQTQDAGGSGGHQIFACEIHCCSLIGMFTSNHRQLALGYHRETQTRRSRYSANRPADTETPRIPFLCMLPAQAVKRRLADYHSFDRIRASFFAGRIEKYQIFSID